MINKLDDMKRRLIVFPCLVYLYTSLWSINPLSFLRNLPKFLQMWYQCYDSTCAFQQWKCLDFLWTLICSGGLRQIASKHGVCFARRRRGSWDILSSVSITRVDIFCTEYGVAVHRALSYKIKILRKKTGIVYEWTGPQLVNHFVAIHFWVLFNCQNPSWTFVH